MNKVGVLRFCADRLEELEGFGHQAKQLRADADQIERAPKTRGKIPKDELCWGKTCLGGWLPAIADGEGNGITTNGSVLWETRLVHPNLWPASRPRYLHLWKNGNRLFSNTPDTLDEAVYAERRPE